MLPMSADGGKPMHVYLTPAAEQIAIEGRIPLDPPTLEWLDREVSIGDVAYDIGAGIAE